MGLLLYILTYIPLICVRVICYNWASNALFDYELEGRDLVPGGFVCTSTSTLELSKPLSNEQPTFFPYF